MSAILEAPRIGGGPSPIRKLRYGLSRFHERHSLSVKGLGGIALVPSPLL